MAAAEKQARPLRGAKKILLASELYINSCRGLCGDIRFIEGRKDTAPADGRGKRGTGIMSSASSAPARKENQGLSLIPI